MPEFDLKQLKFTCSASQPFTNHREIIQTFRETSNLKHLSRNELDKAWFADDAACSDSKDFAKITISDKDLKYRAFEVARNCKYDEYQRALASMIYKIFDQKTGSGVSENEQLADELYKPVIKKLKRRKVYVRFEDNIWIADLSEM